VVILIRQNKQLLVIAGGVLIQPKNGASKAVNGNGAREANHATQNRPGLV
jgi:hypothetical protein